MKKMKRISIILTFLVTMGCQVNVDEPKFDETKITNSNILSKVKYEDSRLEVDNYETLIELLHYVRGMDRLEYRKFVSSFTGFSTMADLYDQLSDIESQESDRLFREFEKTGVFPDRVHPTLPINSKETIRYLDILFFLDGGGFIPFGSSQIPSIELVLNRESEIKVGDEIVIFSNSKFSRSKLSKFLAQARTQNTTSLPQIALNGSQTSGNNRITYDVIFNTPLSSGSISLGGYVSVRNWRRGFFGWNTRRTTELKIEGFLRYNVELGITNLPCSEWICPGCSPVNLCQAIQKRSQVYNNLNLGLNGGNEKELIFNFVLPAHQIPTTYQTSLANRRTFSTDLVLRGENQVTVSVPFFNTQSF